MADVSGPGGSNEDPNGLPPLTFDQRKKIEEQAQRTVSARSGLSRQDIERKVEAYIRRRSFRPQEHPLPTEHRDIHKGRLNPRALDTGRTFSTKHQDQINPLDAINRPSAMYAAMRNIEDQITASTGATINPYGMPIIPMNPFLLNIAPNALRPPSTRPPQEGDFGLINYPPSPQEESDEDEDIFPFED